MPGRAEGGLPRKLLRHVTSLFIFPLLTLPALAADLPAGFVRLKDIDPTIRQDMRYAGSANFLGRPAKGYDAPACILTPEAAEALSKAQKALASEQLTLVVFDCYRPTSAVADFVAWTRQGGKIDPMWSPKVKRRDLVSQGYIAGRSAHSRGSTVDIGIAPLDPAAAAPDPSCGAAGARTLEFGTGFDCFDPTSNTAHAPLPAGASENRRKLVQAMKAQGFRNYAAEWWHFTLNGEPFPRKRFGFPVTAD